MQLLQPPWAARLAAVVERVTQAPQQLGAPVLRSNDRRRSIAR